MNMLHWSMSYHNIYVYEIFYKAYTIYSLISNCKWYWFFFANYWRKRSFKWKNQYWDQISQEGMFALPLRVVLHKNVLFES